MPDDLRHLVDALQTVPQEAGVPKPDPILVVDGGVTCSTGHPDLLALFGMS